MELTKKQRRTLDVIVKKFGKEEVDSRLLVHSQSNPNNVFAQITACSLTDDVYVRGVAMSRMRHIVDRGTSFLEHTAAIGYATAKDLRDLKEEFNRALLREHPLMGRIYLLFYCE